MHILPTISTLFIVISAVFMAIGIAKVRNGQIDGHQKMMTYAAVSALIFFIIYASRTVFIGNTAFGGPEGLVPFYTVFLIFHIILATSGGILGGVQVYLGYKRKLARHRKIAPWASTIWFGTAITGVMVYVLLYVLYPGGETTSLIKAILQG
ncbi:DUF420 domain-containing protein [Salinicoccus sp. ID82-1]|uniref:DUF420 domain-containing protein n=1 Tax=Salinicoccus cyprini TaxID=2493691 RepID=A0A558AXW1_9STAP|nr:DUF420 domain-containing protein [Salinicoccus cyprini]MCG1008621.1 DUF420 domain-containing protein [Salinicoccus sp. ID82-1]TVT29099.1 DUF420 domain-containing protein [Salinicoccus cyprini]